MGTRERHVGVGEAVQELVTDPSLLRVGEEGAGGYAVVQGAVRVLPHEEHRAFGLELALERPRVRVVGRGGEERGSDLAEPSLVRGDDVGVEPAARARGAALEVDLDHDQPSLALLVARQERLEEAPAWVSRGDGDGRGVTASGRI